MRRLPQTLVGVLTLLTLAAVALLAALQAPSIHVPERRSFTFRDVTLVEAGHPARSGRTLHVAEGRISASAPQAVEAPDLSGLFVTPGLTDMHVHYPPALAIGNRELWSLLFLAHGVTTVREMGSIDGSVFQVREKIRAGDFPGPRIFACGAMLDGDPPAFPSNRVLSTPEAARAAVAEQASFGADCIKVYNLLSPELMAAIRDAASDAGLVVVGHVPHSVAFEEAGISDLQHGTGVVQVDRQRIGSSDFLLEDWDTVTPKRIQYAAQVSLGRGIAHTPTLVNARMRRLLTQSAQYGRRMEADSGLRHLPRFWGEAWELIWDLPFSPGDAPGEALHDQFRERQAAMTAGLHAAGVRIHAGTDTLMPFVAPGSSLHGELRDLRDAGIPDRDVWRLATREAGAFLESGGLGTLAIGAPADLLFLRRDPTGDLTALTEIEAVLADGRLYRRADLEAGLARFDRHFRGPLYETTMRLVIWAMADSFAPESAPGDSP